MTVRRPALGVRASPTRRRSALCILLLFLYLLCSTQTRRGGDLSETPVTRTP